MDEKSVKLSAPDEATIEDELRQWPQSINTEVAAAAAKGREQERLAVRKSNTRRKLLLALLVLLVGGVILVPTWLYLRQKPVKTREEIVTNAPRLENSNLLVGRTDNKEDYKQTTASVMENGEEILDVVQYEFYASKFIVDNTELTNQEQMLNTFRGLREELTGNWIVIFAAASVEGHEDYNLRLCRNRLHAVRDMILRDAGTKVRGYWGILAGEYKTTSNQAQRGREEEQEEQAAAKNGEKWLSEQRKLIVITIKEKKPIPNELSNQVPIIVAKHLYKEGVIPKDYDNSNSTPFQLTTGKQ